MGLSFSYRTILGMGSPVTSSLRMTSPPYVDSAGPVIFTVGRTGIAKKKKFFIENFEGYLT